MKKSLFISLFALLPYCATALANDIRKPAEFMFGKSVSEIHEQLEKQCTSLRIRDIVPITAPLAKDKQTQLECSGFQFGGSMRDIELVFQDDQLDLAWILIPAEEKTTMVESFTHTYGAPSFEIPFGTVFLQANAAVRNTPSEVLFVSDRQLQVMLAKLNNSSN